MQHFFQRIWNDETGQDLIEYALLAALVATGSAILIPGRCKRRHEPYLLTSEFLSGPLRSGGG